MRFLFGNKPKIKAETIKSGSYDGWLKCPGCQELVHTNELGKNKNCCPKCDHHFRQTALEKLELLADPGSFSELFSHIQTADPLHFVDSESYPDRVKNAKKKSSIDEAIIVGTCLVQGKKCAIGIMDFEFMGGSMGSVVGERLTSLIEYAIKEKLPVVVVCTSGGARMQESTLSLMQIAKTSAALSHLSESGLPFISILTNPTTGGVTASFAALGDLIFAEPDALICFAGPRVIEQTMRQQLPPGAQRSEFLLKHGMIDRIVRRHELKSRLADCLEFLNSKSEGV